MRANVQRMHPPWDVFNPQEREEWYTKSSLEVKRKRHQVGDISLDLQKGLHSSSYSFFRESARFKNQRGYLEGCSDCMATWPAVCSFKARGEDGEEVKKRARAQSIGCGKTFSAPRPPVLVRVHSPRRFHPFLVPVTRACASCLFLRPPPSALRRPPSNPPPSGHPPPAVTVHGQALRTGEAARAAKVIRAASGYCGTCTTWSTGFVRWRRKPPRAWLRTASCTRGWRAGTQNTPNSA